MMLILNQIFSLFRLLNSETGTKQIAVGIACGLILGFAPSLSLQSILVFILLFIFRIQMGAAFLAAFFFAFIAWILDPINHWVGSRVLEIEALHPLYTTLYNMPIIPFTRFYNSVTMGAGVISIVLALPVYFISQILIAKYRTKVVERFKENKYWKMWTGTVLYSWYTKYASL